MGSQRVGHNRGTEQPTLPTRGPRVLFFKGRASSKCSKKSSVPVARDRSETKHPQMVFRELLRSHHSLVLSLQRVSQGHGQWRQILAPREEPRPWELVGVLRRTAGKWSELWGDVGGRGRGKGEGRGVWDLSTAALGVGGPSQPLAAQQHHLSAVSHICSI